MRNNQWLKSLAEKIAAGIDEEFGEAYSFIKITNPPTLFRTERVYPTGPNLATHGDGKRIVVLVQRTNTF